MAKPRNTSTSASMADRLQSARRTAAGVRQRSVATRQAKSEARRDAILAAALDEFSVSGFAAARLDDVARRAGIAKGTIYLYFRDKETLFQELIRSMLAPLVGSIEALGASELPMQVIADNIVETFVREVLETRRKDVIRLIIAEGRRFPQLAEFYYREVLSRIIAAVRAILRRAVERGEAPSGLVEFPQIIAGPALLAIVWSGLFERFEPLDVRKMMQTHIELLFAPRRAT
jgi:AcrR family transcriptional regulator